MHTLEGRHASDANIEFVDPLNTCRPTPHRRPRRPSSVQPATDSRPALSPIHVRPRLARTSERALSGLPSMSFEVRVEGREDRGTRRHAETQAPRLARGLGFVKRHRRVLKHPLLLLILGTGVTIVLTQRWHDREATLDSNRAELVLKTRLLREIDVLHISQVGFIDDGFSSAKGVRDSKYPKPSLALRGTWNQSEAEIEDELRAWFPDRPTGALGTAADGWRALESRTLAIEKEQASLKAVPLPPDLASMDVTKTNESALGVEMGVLTAMHEIRLRDKTSAEPDAETDQLWRTAHQLCGPSACRSLGRSVSNAPRATTLGKPDTQIEAAIHSAAVAELNDARARLARRLLASKAKGYRQS
jgi:hypothetical protein